MYLYYIYLLLLLDLADLLAIVISLILQINVQTVLPDRATSNKAYLSYDALKLIIYTIFFLLGKCILLAISPS